MACGPDYETEQLRIKLGDGATRGFCAGDLQFFQGEVDRIEDALGIRMTKPLDLVYSPSLRPDSSGVEGRYIHARHRVETNANAVSHELVHAVLGRPAAKSMDWFFIEGIAEALNGTHTRMPGVLTKPSENIGRSDSIYVDYPSAAHFMRWLYEERGAVGIRGLRDGRSFFDVYGESLGSAEERWWASAPWLYPAPDPCPFAPIDVVDGAFVSSVELSCEDDDVRSGALPGLFTCRTFDIEREGLYLFSASVDSWAERCQSEIIEEPPEVEREAVPAAFDYNRPSKYLSAGEEHEVLFRAGRHMVCFGIEDDLAGVVEISVVPTETALVRP